MLSDASFHFVFVRHWGDIKEDKNGSPRIHAGSAAKRLTVHRLRPYPGLAVRPHLMFQLTPAAHDWRFILRLVVLRGFMSSLQPPVLAVKAESQVKSSFSGESKLPFVATWWGVTDDELEFSQVKGRGCPEALLCWVHSVARTFHGLQERHYSPETTGSFAVPTHVSFPTCMFSSHDSQEHGSRL